MPSKYRGTSLSREVVIGSTCKWELLPDTPHCHIRAIPPCYRVIRCTPQSPDRLTFRIDPLTPAPYDVTHGLGLVVNDGSWLWMRYSLVIKAPDTPVSLPFTYLDEARCRTSSVIEALSDSNSRGEEIRRMVHPVWGRMMMAGLGSATLEVGWPCLCTSCCRCFRPFYRY